MNLNCKGICTATDQYNHDHGGEHPVDLGGTVAAVGGAGKDAGTVFLKKKESRFHFFFTQVLNTVDFQLVDHYTVRTDFYNYIPTKLKFS